MAEDSGHGRRANIERQPFLVREKSPPRNAYGSGSDGQGGIELSTGGVDSSKARACFSYVNVYAKTNQIIHESRPYIPGKILTRYLYVYFMRLVFVVYLCLVLPTLFVPASIAWPWAVTMGLLGLGWLAVFCQHLYVVVITVPWLLSQPIVPNYQQSVSSRVWLVAKSRLDEFHMGVRDRCVGLFDRNSGLVQYNRLNRTAEVTIYLTVIQSCTMFFLSLLAVCLSVAVAGWKYGLAVDSASTVPTANSTYILS